ncbi:hypothetical protein [Phytohabitans kaempferiae]|uniref:Uncharacterized protein n=1 Tax=Phytohabitans kaempferiae TaxID=1620943 RepID=A0ABV6M7X1_9ACTN
MAGSRRPPLGSRLDVGEQSAASLGADEVAAHGEALDARGVGDVAQWVGVRQYQVSDLAPLDRALIAAAEVAGGIEGGARTPRGASTK